MHSADSSPECQVSLILLIHKICGKCAHIISCGKLVVLSLVFKSGSLLCLSSSGSSLCLLCFLFLLELLISDSIVKSFKLVKLVSDRIVINEKLLLCSLHPACRKNEVNTNYKSGKTCGKRSCDKKTTKLCDNRKCSSQKTDKRIYKCGSNHKYYSKENGECTDYVRKIENALFNGNVLTGCRSLCNIKNCSLSCCVNCLKEQEYYNENCCTNYYQNSGYNVNVHKKVFHSGIRIIPPVKNRYGNHSNCANRTNNHKGYGDNLIEDFCASIIKRELFE